MHMMCRYPQYSKTAGIEHPCGQCHHCRHNKRREWTHRIILESHCHSSNIFLTLTYNDQHLVFNNKDSVLYYPDVSDFLDRLRHRKGIKPFRFYCVGEYGEQTQRPHYHLAMFGVDASAKSIIEDCWKDDLGPMGHIHIGTLTLDSAGYIAGYINKKMTKPDDPRLEGRDPEFSVMSRRPGIGVPYVSKLVQDYRVHLEKIVTVTGDVPKTLRHGTKVLPLGRLLVDRLRKELNVSHLKEAHAADYKTQVRIMRELRADAALYPKSPLGLKIRNAELERRQVMLNRETLSNIHKKRKLL
nr:MAG: replication initiator protein [Microvirus sp.]